MGDLVYFKRFTYLYVTVCCMKIISHTLRKVKGGNRASDGCKRVPYCYKIGTYMA